MVSVARSRWRYQSRPVTLLQNLEPVKAAGTKRQRQALVGVSHRKGEFPSPGFTLLIVTAW